MSEVELMLVATEARSACKGESSLEARIRKAMRASVDHWMVIDEDKQFRGSLAGVMMESDEEDKDRITRSLKPLQFLSAMLTGIPVDQEAMSKALEHDDLIPLRKIWDEVKAEKKR